MLDHWRKINIDTYISNLKDFYQDSSKGYFRTGSFVESLNQEEKEYLNLNINIDKLIGVEKKYIINKLLEDKTKTNFVRYILNSYNINIEVNSVNETNKSIFQLLLEQAEESPENFDFYMLLNLYKRGYSNTASDEIFLINFYKTKLKNEKLFEIWSLARISFKLNHYEKIEKILAKVNVVFSVLSFKIGKPIGLNFPNLHGIANNAIQHYREHGDLLFLAMKIYKVYDDILARDKKGTFKLKEKDYYQFKPIQDIEFNDIVVEIFPELNKN